MKMITVVTFRDGKDIVDIVALDQQHTMIDANVKAAVIEHASNILAARWNNTAREMGEPEQADKRGSTVAVGLEIEIHTIPLSR